METPLGHARQRSLPRWWGAVGLVGVIGLLVAIWCVTRPLELPPGISLSEYRDAARRFKSTYHTTASRVDVISLLGELAVAGERLEVAVQCFHEIPTEDPRYGLSARLQEGQVLLKLNRADEAEQCFRIFLERAQSSESASLEHLVAAQKWLTYILTVELRFEERQRILAEVQANELADVFDSKQYHFPNLLIWNSAAGRSRLRQFLSQDPENPRLQVAQGRYLTAEGRLAEARLMLEKLVARHPQMIDGHAALLECYFEQGDWPPLLTLVASLPAYQATEPWLLTRLRAEGAAHQQHWDDAIRHYERVLKVDPANPWCHMGLARAYAALHRPADREQMLQRSLILSKIRVDLIKVNEQDAGAARDLAVLCGRGHLVDAAQTFRRHAQRIGQSRPRAQPPGGG